MKQLSRKTINLILFIAYCLLITAYFLLPSPVSAQDPSYEEINEVAKQLNCPTCQGINLADCRTQTCAQWKDQIADLLRDGYTSQEVVDYFSTTYGTQVLQEPPRSGFTLILWVFPVIALIGGGAWLFFTLRRWSDRQPLPEAAGPTTNSPPPPSAQVSDDYLSQVERDLGLDEAG